MAQFNNQASLSCSRPVNHLGFDRLIIHNYTSKHSKCRIATVRFPSSNNVVSFPWEILWNIFYVSFHDDTILSRKQQQQHLNKPVEETFKLIRRHLRSKRHNMLEMSLPANIWLSLAHYESTKTNPLKRTWSEDIPEEILTKIKNQNVKAHQIVDRYKHCYWLYPQTNYILVMC